MPADPKSTTAPPGNALDGGSAVSRILATGGLSYPLPAVARALGGSYRCEFAAGAGEAHDKLAGGGFELVLCGLTLPGTPGLALATEIGTRYPDVAVVLVGREDDPEIAREAFAAGAYGYLVEPIGPGQLLITVMSALRRRELELVARSVRENLAEQRQQVIDMAPMPIYAKDASHRYVLANLQADALAGCAPGELVGLGDEHIMEPAALERMRATDRRIFERGTAYDREETITIGGIERTIRRSSSRCATRTATSSRSAACPPTSPTTRTRSGFGTS